MVNYPYPSNFLSPLPGWPVKEACKFLSTTATSDEEAARQMYQVANLFYNYTGQFNLKTKKKLKVRSAVSVPIWTSAAEDLRPSVTLSAGHGKLAQKW